MTFDELETKFAEFAFKAYDEGMDLTAVYVAALRCAAAIGLVALGLPGEEALKDFKVVVDVVGDPEGSFFNGAEEAAIVELGKLVRDSAKSKKDSN